MSDDILQTAHGWLTHYERVSGGLHIEGRGWRPNGPAGYPDLTLCREGVLIIAELKRESGGVVSEAQREWLDELPSDIVRLWRPRDAAAIIAELEEA